jgi:hypothetical protein
MNFSLRNPVGITAIVVLAIAVVLAGSALFAGTKAPAMAASGCGMQQGSAQSGQGCAMMGGGGSESCPMSKDGGTMGMMHGGSGCAMLAGKVVSVGRDGSITVRVKPAANAPDATRKAVGQLKVGDGVSMMMMLDKAQSGASAGTAHKVAKYACPMHPEVTSDKPGQCPKCGMNLELANPQNK